MAKKFVRGITDIKNIEHQDYDTNNVNDLLSDGKHNYIHRKKTDGSEEYHNLTNNIKTIESSNTSLLSVTNYNNSTNSARLTPKHDRRKEQVLESTDNTILIEHGENGTDETTNVDVNPAKVLEHDNLISNSDYVTIQHVEGSNTSQIKTDNLETELEELNTKIPKKLGTVNLFEGSSDFSGTKWDGNAGTYAEDYQNVKIFKKNTKWSGRTQYFEVKTGEEYVFSAYVKSSEENDSVTFLLNNSSKQPTATGLVGFDIPDSQNTLSIDLTDEYQRIAIKIKITSDGWIAPRIERSNDDAYLFFGGYKLERTNIPSDWTPAPEDYDTKLAKKQNTLTSNSSIGVDGTGLMQLYSYEMSYTVTSAVKEGSLNTYAKTVKKVNLLSDETKLEYHFTAELKEGHTSITIPLNNNDKTYFSYILIKYGQQSGSTQTAMINGLVFSLSGSNLTISRDSSTYNQVVSFSDIIDPSQDTTQ